MITAQAKLDCLRICSRGIEALRVAVITSRGKISLGPALKVSHSVQEWFEGAKAGDRYVYHVGFLLLDRKRGSVIDFVARVARELYAAGYVYLSQSKEPKGETVYIMSRSRKGLIPPQAMHGTAGSTPSAVYNGDAPAVNKDGGFSPPRRPEKSDGKPRPGLSTLEQNND